LRSSFIIFDVDSAREVHHLVSPPAVDEGLARDGMVEGKGLREAELYAKSVPKDRGRGRISSEGPVREVELKGASHAAGTLGAVFRWAEGAICGEEICYAELEAFLRAHVLLVEGTAGGLQAAGERSSRMEVMALLLGLPVV
jgi:hypothetical protein